MVCISRSWNVINWSTIACFATFPIIRDVDEDIRLRLLPRHIVLVDLIASLGRRYNLQCEGKNRIKVLDRS